MKHKLARFWEKYDGIILPVLVAMLTMWAGIMIGTKATLTDQALMCSQRVLELGNELGVRNGSSPLIDAAKSTAEAAKLSAESAKKSATAAQKAAEQPASNPLRTE